MSNEKIKFLMTETDYDSNSTRITNIEILPNKKKILKSKFFLTTKKGKLFTQPNFTAFNKPINHNSTIPSKKEKHLIKASSLKNILLNKNLNKLFANHIKILASKNKNKNNKNKLNNENNILYSTNIKNNNFLLKNNFNKKGYGNGFLSKSLRFFPIENENKPGPGEYNQKTFEIKNKVDKSLFGKSLFLPKSNFSLIENKPFPSVGHYTISLINNNNYKNSFFKFKGDRFKNGFFENIFKNKNPGPGKYFNNKINNDIKINNDYLKTNYFFKEKKIKKDSDENRLKINKGDKKIFKYKLTDNHNKGEVVNYWKGIPKIGEDIKEYKNINNNNDNKFNFNSDNNNNNNDNDNINKKHYFCGYRIDGEDLIGCIPNNLDNNKPQIFELNSPRWRNDNSFKVPGPAYYHPKIPNSKVSFNITNKKFIYTNSFPYLQTNEENKIFK